jgi:PKD repeat protein
MKWPGGVLVALVCVLVGLGAEAQAVYNGGRSGGLITLSGGQSLNFIPGNHPGPESLWISVNDGGGYAILSDGSGGQTSSDFYLRTGDLLLFPVTQTYHLQFLGGQVTLLFGGTLYNRPGAPICDTGLQGPSILKVDRLMNLMTQSHASGNPKVQVWAWFQTTRKTSGNVTYTLVSDPRQQGVVNVPACSGADCCQPLEVGFALKNWSGDTYTVVEMDAGGAYNFDWNTAVPAPFTCTASASTKTGTAPLDVTFAASASGGATGYQYHWNFGDGNISNRAQVTHTYTAGGTFIWKMTATDLAGQTCIKSGQLKIAGTLKVTGAAAPRQGDPPLSVAFTSTAKGAKPPYTYLWDFGDGTTAATPSANHTFASAGAYDCTLEVTDSEGKNAFAAVPVYVGVPIPPNITGVTVLPGPPFQLKVSGTDFQSGCSVTLNGQAPPQVLYKSSTKILLGGGAALKTMVPKGTAVCVDVHNPDGGDSDCFSYTR